MNPNARTGTMLRNLAIALLLPALGGAALPRPTAPGNVSALRLEGRAGRTELTVQVSGGEVRWNAFALQGPARVVVDIEGAKSDLSASRYDGIDRGGVKGVRSSQHAADVVRLVLDLDRELQYTVTRVPEGIRISLESGAQAFQPWSSGAASAAAPVASRPPARPAGPAQYRPRTRARPITGPVETPDMREVLSPFAELTGRSIVPGSEVGSIR